MKQIIRLIPLALLTLAANSQAAEPPFLAQPAGQAVVINGKTYYKQVPQSKIPNGVSARSTGTPAPSLKRGDVVQAPKQRVPATVSGTVLVQLASPNDEAAVARDHGLTVRYRTASIVIFNTPAQADLLALQQKLAADKRVKKAQLELASNDKQAE
ncbi:hypothetical protein [Chromobacterium piscinae]|uniref:ASP external chaperone domain-containing protein n=1 Tax=Chromobacterium piscinae TaxID=686831 RepID=A0ABV0HCM1_9NEIS|nr:hypothetical protein [Chromobacterium piscinae]MBX9297231.1 hypothetical protein [Chromobacterium vaccinii]MBX9359054.1 hypothetical protein [Chromobacterium vaccinii]MCD4503857.1 hypothetical protein [Chromobacterium piscinae]NHQ83328.1 hypothetical protein [Chromobacterium vaccinii]